MEQSLLNTILGMEIEELKQKAESSFFHGISVADLPRIDLLVLIGAMKELHEKQIRQLRQDAFTLEATVKNLGSELT